MDKKERKNRNTYLRFSSVGIQMGITIGGAAYLGNYLDKKYANETPVWTIVCCLVGIGIGLYMVIKEVLNMSKENDKKD